MTHLWLLHLSTFVLIPILTFTFQLVLCFLFSNSLYDSIWLCFAWLNSYCIDSTCSLYKLICKSDRGWPNLRVKVKGWSGVRVRVRNFLTTSIPLPFLGVPGVPGVTKGSRPHSWSKLKWGMSISIEPLQTNQVAYMHPFLLYCHWSLFLFIWWKSSELISLTHPLQSLPEQIGSMVKPYISKAQTIMPANPTTCHDLTLDTKIPSSFDWEALLSAHSLLPTCTFPNFPFLSPSSIPPPTLV